MSEDLNMLQDPNNGMSQFLRGLLGAVGGVASRHKAGNILMSGLRGGMLGAREGVSDDGIEEGGGYLEALLNVPAGWGYDPNAGGESADKVPLQELFGGGSLGYLNAPGGPLAAQMMHDATSPFALAPTDGAPGVFAERPTAPQEPSGGYLSATPLLSAAPPEGEAEKKARFIPRVASERLYEPALSMESVEQDVRDAIELLNIRARRASR